ncbi:hypothetical protein MASR1M42_11390 [Azonexus hydrophilus]
MQINDGIRIWIYAGPDRAPLSKPTQGICANADMLIENKSFSPQRRRPNMRSLWRWHPGATPDDKERTCPFHPATRGAPRYVR